MTNQNIVDVMNDLFKTDPNAIDAILCNRVPVNQKRLDHPTAMCSCKNEQCDFPTIGLLGILNAIASVDDGVIKACYDSDSYCLTHFELA